MTATTSTSYSSAEAERAAGITHRQLVYWVDQGVLTPSVTVARGSGTQNRWSAADIRTMRVVAELLTLGCDVRTIRLVPEVLDYHCGERWLLAGPGRVRVCTDEELLQALVTDAPSWHVVRLSAILHGLPDDDDAAAR